MPDFNPKIFKSYDVRGIYPSDLTNEVAYKIGRAYASLTNVKTVVVGKDMRLGGEELFENLTRGLLESGLEVIDIGMVPIDGVYFAAGKYGYDGGIMITASHNPKEYNGFKMFKMDKKGIDVIRGVDIKEAVEAENFVDGKGNIEKRDVWEDYIRHVFSFVDVDKIKPLKVVIDAGNGMAGKVIPELEKRLSLEIIKMNFEVDGSFPAHPSNPLEPESHEPLQKRVVEEKADVGFIFDGDTDRVFIIDNKGEFLRGDTTLIFLAKYFLDASATSTSSGQASLAQGNKKGGDKFVYNAICSRAVPETIEKMGGKAFREKVGYVNLNSRMKKEGAVLSGEVSGHYSFATNFYADSGFITFVMILQVLSESGEPMSEMVSDFNPYNRGDEINIEVEDIEAKLQVVRDNYKDYKQDELDGVTVDAWEGEGWWINVRPSNTEPLLRITVEGKDEGLLKGKQEEVLQVLQS